MATWKQLSEPYTKYVYSDPNANYTPTPSSEYNAALASTLDFSSYPTYASSSGGGGGGGGSSAPIDYRAMIEADPYYTQAKADISAQSIADAAQRAAAIKRTLIDWGVIPDFAAAGDKLGLSSTALGFLTSDVDQRTKDLAAENEAQGLSMHSRLGKANEDNIRAIRNALAARGMYTSGELGYGLTENAQQYKQASTDAEKQVLGGLEEVSGRFVQGERDRQRQIADAMKEAAQRSAMGMGSSGPYGSAGGGGGGVTADFIYDSTPQGGYNYNDYWNAAVAGAPAGAVPMHVMSQGMIQDGKVSIKYMMPDGHTNTIWVPISSATPPPAAAPAPAPAPASSTAPSGSAVVPYYAPRPRGAI